MIGGTLRRSWFRSLFLSSLDWIQAEVFSYCNAACVYCLHTVYRDAWVKRHLPVKIFERLMADIAKARLVYLQGWGEPLLHPNFLALVRIAESRGPIEGGILAARARFGLDLYRRVR